MGGQGVETPDANGHAVSHRLADQSDHERRSADARRRGQTEPQRSGWQVHPVVRQDDGRGAGGE